MDRSCSVCPPLFLSLKQRNTSALTVVGFMASHRRRHHNHHRFRFLIPVISSVSGALLLLFAFLSFLAPSPGDVDHLHRYPQRLASSNNGVDDAAGVPVFRVPSSGGISDRDIWSSKLSQFYYGCSNASKNFLQAEAIMHPNGYLLIATSGGLNQQRTGITDGVVAARILNATLVVPTLDQKSFWKDASNFSEIFDVDWFISNLSSDVKIIKALPERGGKTWTPYTMRVPRKCNERCYQTRLLPALAKRGAVRLTKYDYRLSNRLDTDLQKLRCRVNYHSLRFTDPITRMGEKLVHRMRNMSKHYIALHLRFEPDMLAFSGCYYGGGEKERAELGKIRKRWKTLHKSNPDKGRRQGRCPLTPEEVGLMLRALGYDKNVHIYVASGVVYRGEETLAPLKALFPNFHSKETIASKDELKPFFGFSSRMAALDFIVCDQSDVFVTNNNGNMAKMLAGRRRYFGHKPTIRPNAKKLYRLFLNRANMTWEEFASGVQSRQKGFVGEPMEVRPGRGVFHENPYPCICENTEAKSKVEDKGPRKLGMGNNNNNNNNSAKRKEDSSQVVDDQSSNDNEIEWSDLEDEDDLNSQGKNQSNETNGDYDPSVNEERELEEMLSD